MYFLKHGQDMKKHGTARLYNVYRGAVQLSFFKKQNGAVKRQQRERKAENDLLPDNS